MTREGRIRFELEGEFKRSFVDVVADADKFEMDSFVSHLTIDATDVGDTESASVILPHPALNPGAHYHIEAVNVGLADVLIRDYTDSTTLATLASDGSITYLSVGTKMVEIG